MKKTAPVLVVLCALGFALSAPLAIPQTTETKSPVPVRFEYATVRFMETRTTIFWPDGRTENLMEVAGGKKKFPGGEYYPKGTDYRMYWLTVAMNRLAREGFTLVQLHDEDLIMKREAR